MTIAWIRTHLRNVVTSNLSSFVVASLWATILPLYFVNPVLTDETLIGVAVMSITLLTATVASRPSYETNDFYALSGASPALVAWMSYKSQLPSLLLAIAGFSCIAAWQLPSQRLDVTMSITLLVPAYATLIGLGTVYLTNRRRHLRHLVLTSLFVAYLGAASYLGSSSSLVRYAGFDTGVNIVWRFLIAVLTWCLCWLLVLVVFGDVRSCEPPSRTARETNRPIPMAVHNPIPSLVPLLRSKDIVSPLLGASVSMLVALVYLDFTGLDPESAILPLSLLASTPAGSVAIHNLRDLRFRWLAGQRINNMLIELMMWSYGVGFACLAPLLAALQISGRSDLFGAVVATYLTVTGHILLIAIASFMTRPDIRQLGLELFASFIGFSIMVQAAVAILGTDRLVEIVFAFAAVDAVAFAAIVLTMSDRLLAQSARITGSDRGAKW